MAKRRRTQAQIEAERVYEKNREGRTVAARLNAAEGRVLDERLVSLGGAKKLAANTYLRGLILADLKINEPPPAKKAKKKR